MSGFQYRNVELAKISIAIVARPNYKDELEITIPDLPEVKIPLPFTEFLALIAEGGKIVDVRHLQQYNSGD